MKRDKYNRMVGRRTYRRFPQFWEDNNRKFFRTYIERMTDSQRRQHRKFCKVIRYLMSHKVVCKR